MGRAISRVCMFVCLVLKNENGWSHQHYTYNISLSCTDAEVKTTRVSPMFGEWFTERLECQSPARERRMSASYERRRRQQQTDGWTTADHADASSVDDMMANQSASVNDRVVTTPRDDHSAPSDHCAAYAFTIHRHPRHVYNPPTPAPCLQRLLCTDKCKSQMWQGSQMSLLSPEWSSGMGMCCEKKIMIGWRNVWSMKWRVPGQEVGQRKLGERLWKKTVKHVDWIGRMPRIEVDIIKCLLIDGHLNLTQEINCISYTQILVYN